MLSDELAKLGYRRIDIGLDLADRERVRGGAVGIDGEVEHAIAAVRAGLPVLLPTDTVYGLAASAEREEYATRVYRLKGREETQPTALLAASVDGLFECLPELAGRAELIVRALLPGPYTLVLPEPCASLPLAHRRAHRRDRRARAGPAGGDASRRRSAGA